MIVYFVVARTPFIFRWHKRVTLSPMLNICDPFSSRKVTNQTITVDYNKEVFHTTRTWNNLSQHSIAPQCSFLFDFVNQLTVGWGKPRKWREASETTMTSSKSRALIKEMENWFFREIPESDGWRASRIAKFISCCYNARFVGDALQRVQSMSRVYLYLVMGSD